MHQPPIPQIDAEDPQIAGLIHDEARRQAEKFRLIPSENYVSLAVLEACGTVLTNKYSEGYPGRRYYEGQQLTAPLESIAIERAQALFGADHANVQPYSGSPANLAVYLAFAKPGDTILAMSLSAGGHLTHGSPASVTGKWFRAVHYGVRRETGRVDMDDVRELALEEMPHIAGLIAGGAHPSPVGYAPVITTTTHKTLRGPRGAMILTDAEHASPIEKAVFPGLQGGPHNHTTAGIAVAL